MEELFKLQDEKYAEFSFKLAPTLNREVFIGVRVPEIRKLAKELYGTPKANEFIKELPHKYYEENLLHSFLIAQIKDFDTCLKEVERFIPYMDNWAVTDTLNPKVFSKHLDEVLIKTLEWTKSSKVYVSRFGINLLMRYFLDYNYKKEYLYLVRDIPIEDYYIKMMKAWYFATALISHYDDVIELLQSNTLDKWVHNKTIQKAKESFRINSSQKDYLTSIRRK